MIEISLSLTLICFGYPRDMKLFKIIRHHFSFVGIYPVQNQQKSHFNLMNLFVLILYVQLFISSLTFFLLKAKTINEYVYTLYVCISCLSAFGVFLTTILKKKQIYQLIDKYEEAIERSKEEILDKITQIFNENKTFDLISVFWIWYIFISY